MSKGAFYVKPIMEKVLIMNFASIEGTSHQHHPRFGLLYIR